MSVDDRLQRAAERLNSSLADEPIPPVPTPGVRRWRAFAVAAMATIAVVGGVALLTQFRGDDVDPGGTTTPGAPSTLPVTTAPTQPEALPGLCPLAFAASLPDPRELLGPCRDGDGDIIEWIEGDLWVVIEPAAAPPCDIGTTVDDLASTEYTRQDLMPWYRTAIDRLEQVEPLGSVGLYEQVGLLGITLCDFDEIDLIGIPEDAVFFESWPDRTDHQPVTPTTAPTTSQTFKVYSPVGIELGVSYPSSFGGPTSRYADLAISVDGVWLKTWTATPDGDADEMAARFSVAGNVVEVARAIGPTGTEVVQWDDVDSNASVFTVELAGWTFVIDEPDLAPDRVATALRGSDIDGFLVVTSLDANVVVGHQSAAGVVFDGIAVGVSTACDEGGTGSLQTTNGAGLWCIDGTYGVAAFSSDDRPIEVAYEGVSVAQRAQIADPAGGPLFGEPTGVVLLFDDGIDGVLAIDPDRRIGSRLVIEGQSAGDQPFRLTRVGDHLVVGWSTIWAASIETGESTRLGNSVIYVPAAEDDRVWMVDFVGGVATRGPADVWQVGLDGTVLTDPVRIDAFGYPVLGVPGGLVLGTPDGLAIWDAASASIVTTYDMVGEGDVSDVSGSRLLWCDADCAELVVTDVASGREPVRVAAADVGTAGAGFDVWQFGARTARFSPDGGRIVAVAGESLVVIDAGTGDVERVASMPSADAGYFTGWSPGGTQVFATSYSYGGSETTLVHLDLATGTTATATLPFGGALSFVVLEAGEAGAFLVDQPQPPTACRGPFTQPSDRTGICGFRF